MQEKDFPIDTGRVANLSFSFIFTLGTVIELLIVIFLLLGGYFILNRYSKELENSFIENGKQWVVNADVLAKNTIRQKNYSLLTEAYISSINNAQKSGSSIKETFFLSKAGIIKAHNDYSEIANPKLDGVKQISSRYNNEYFHAALQKEEGEILIQNYDLEPNIKFSIIAKLAHLFLPKNLSYTSDFSTAVYVQGKAEGTVHIIISRSYIHTFLPDAIRGYLILSGFFLLGGILLTFLLTLLFSARIHYLENIWKTVFHNDGSIYHKLSQVEQKIDLLETQPKSLPVQKKHEQEEETKIVEAIFVED